MIQQPAVESPPVITQLSQSISLLEGGSAELTVVVEGAAPIKYQWSKGVFC